MRSRRLAALGRALNGHGDDDEISPMDSLGIAFLLGLPLAAMTSILCKSLYRDAKRIEFHEILVLAWYIIDAMTHLTIELAYVVLALTTTAEKSDSFMGWLWREYSRADARWAVRDPNVISLELLTVFIGILCLFQVRGVLCRESWRHPLQMVICTAELYGGWMTFCPEWVQGSPNLNGQDPILLWIYLVFMNGLWVVIPGLLLWDSFVRLSFAADSSSSHFHELKVTTGKGAPARIVEFKYSVPSRTMWYAGAATILAYCILVPAVLFTAPGGPMRGSEL